MCCKRQPTWGMTEDPMCRPCQKPANLVHILSSCQVATTQGRYTWRHKQVLKALAHTLDTVRKKDHRQSEHPRRANTRDTTLQCRGGILSIARDWEQRIDLERKLIFPSNTRDHTKTRGPTYMGKQKEIGGDWADSSMGDPMSGGPWK